MKWQPPTAPTHPHDRALPRGFGMVPRGRQVEPPRALVPFVARTAAYAWVGVVLVLIAWRLLG
jgi:hypothetical protein